MKGLDRGPKVITMPSLLSEYSVATITIRNLDDELKARLRIRAAHQERSMEDEVRHILRTALSPEAAAGADLNFGETIHKRFQALGGVKLKLPRRAPIRRPPKVGA